MIPPQPNVFIHVPALKRPQDGFTCPVPFPISPIPSFDFLVLLLELMPFFVVVAGFLFAVLDSFSFTCNSGVVADNTFSPTEEADKKLVIMAGSVGDGSAIRRTCWLRDESSVPAVFRCFLCN